MIEVIETKLKHLRAGKLYNIVTDGKLVIFKPVIGFNAIKVPVNMVGAVRVKEVDTDRYAM